MSVVRAPEGRFLVSDVRRPHTRGTYPCHGVWRSMRHSPSPRDPPSMAQVGATRGARSVGRARNGRYSASDGAATSRRWHISVPRGAAAERRRGARRARDAKLGCSRRAAVGLSSLRVAPGQASASRAPRTRRHPRCRRGKGGLPGGRAARRARGQRRAHGRSTSSRRRLLVQVIREDLGLTGTHVGCDTSQCGACTVHVDGRAVKSCTMLAVQADGASVTTIEGHGRATARSTRSRTRSGRSTASSAASARPG